MTWLRKLLFFLVMTSLFTAAGLLDNPKSNAAIAKTDRTTKAARLACHHPKTERRCKRGQPI